MPTATPERKFEKEGEQRYIFPQRRIVERRKEKGFVGMPPCKRFLKFLSLCFGVLLFSGIPAAEALPLRYISCDLLLSEPDPAAELLRKWDPARYGKLTIFPVDDCREIPELPELDLRHIELNTLHCRNLDDQAIDLAPLMKFHLNTFEFRGNVTNFQLLPTDRLTEINGTPGGVIDTSGLNGRSFPVLETLIIAQLHGRTLDLRGAPKLRKLVIFQAEQLEEIQLAPDVTLEHLDLNTPQLAGLPEFPPETLQTFFFASNSILPREGNPQTTENKWRFEDFKHLRFPNVVHARFAGIGGRELILPEMPNLKFLELGELEIETLDALKDSRIFSLTLWDLPALADFHALAELPLLEVKLYNIPAASWGIPEGVPRNNGRCKVICEPGWQDNPVIAWMIYGAIAGVLGCWVVVYQRFIRDGKDSKNA